MTWVIKLGGSLGGSPQLESWLEALALHGGGRVVIVPGGGPFTGHVRELQERHGFDDSAAHHMSLLAMEQFGLMFCALKSVLVPAARDETIRNALTQGAVPVWLPRLMLTHQPEIPESWDVTSDSLAAWLARKLNASRLLLVKSCELPASGVTALDLKIHGIVDPLFPQFARDGGFEVGLAGKDDYSFLEGALRSSATLGIQVDSR